MGRAAEVKKLRVEGFAGTVPAGSSACIPAAEHLRTLRGFTEPAQAFVIYQALQKQVETTTPLQYRIL